MAHLCYDDHVELPADHESDDSARVDHQMDCILSMLFYRGREVVWLGGMQRSRCLDQKSLRQHLTTYDTNEPAGHASIYPDR